MITAWDIYLIGIVDHVRPVFGIFGFLLGAIFGAIYFVWKYDDDFKEKSKTPWLTGMTIGIIMMIIAIFTPSSKTLVAMYLVPAIAANEDVQQIPGNAAKLLNEKLKDWLKELEVDK